MARYEVSTDNSTKMYEERGVIISWLWWSVSLWDEISVIHGCRSQLAESGHQPLQALVS